ncbi:fimbrial protein [Paraburkholderia acidicola]|uniref:Fimbrial protein n=1 Tax=Paraburkholderia acidicola TaxID=1912599 RepID=A0A2A4F3B0_9BURK|nr:fimbrial protein [Paraburkholderia acidicola]
MIRRRPISIAACSLFVVAIASGQTDAYGESAASAEQSIAQVQFDPSFLHHSAGTSVDVSRYARGNIVKPGTYRADVYVTGRLIGRMDVPFKAMPDNIDAQPCFDADRLQQIGVDPAAYLERARTTIAENGTCLALPQVLADASATFDFNNQRLDLDIPQASLVRRARNYVDPQQWIEGVAVGTLGYNLNLYRSQAQSSGSTTYGYLGLDTGFNLGSWHFRHRGAFNWSDRGERRYDSISTYVQRNLQAWSSQLVIGDAYTSGDLFDSTAFRGVRVFSDDRMLPDSQRGYAPVIRGVANSNARVTVTQGGTKLYETNVSPGAFVIDDLYPTGYGGDLDVAVTEADGTVRTFKVPYASVPMSLRTGQNRYSVTAGMVRGDAHATHPPFVQATWQRGFNNALTGYGGVTLAQGYMAVLAGGVLNTTWGAFGADITQATTSIPGDRHYSGSSVRLSYAKNIEATRTNFTLAAYRYSTGGYFSLNDAVSARERVDRSGPAGIWRQRNRASVTMVQALGEHGGTLNLTASTSTYWNRSGSDIDYSVGYSNAFHNVLYSISATRQRDAFGRSSAMYYLNVSIPLGGSHSVSTSFSRDTQGAMQMQTNLSGLLGREGDWGYGLSVGHSSGSGTTQTDGSANLNYHGSFADLSAGTQISARSQQFSFNAHGAIVGHPGGITFSQPLSETFAIVKAPYAEGARVANIPGVRVDSSGYAVIPYLTPFKLNDVSLDPKGISIDVELKETSQQVAPLAGAVPMIVFKTAYGRSAIVRLRQATGASVPFGALVVDARGQSIGTVGQAGKFLARGLQDNGEVTVKWEAMGHDLTCRVDYSLPVRDRAAKSRIPPTLDLSCPADASPAPTSESSVL